MKVFSENLKTVYTLAALIGVCFVAFTYFASAERVERLELRVDAGFLEDRANNMQKRIWALEDRHGEGCARCSQTVKEEYRGLVEDLKKLRKQIEAMTQKKYKG